jgi:Cu-Zn family superoxide dismutase
VTDHASLSDGPVSVFDANGSSVVVHALPDDFVTNPAGNSGARIACGVIEAE